MLKLNFELEGTAQKARRQNKKMGDGIMAFSALLLNRTKNMEMALTFSESQSIWEAFPVVLCNYL